MNALKVRQLRDRHGLTQTAFARLVYTTARTVKRWEQGKSIDPARFELAAWKLDDDLAMEQVVWEREQ